MVSAKLELSYESLKSKFSLIHFAYNLMIGYSKNYPRVLFDKKKKTPELKFNSRLALD